MKRSKGFSLIEILIVLSIILIFLIAFPRFFKPKDVQVYNGQKCVNELYSFINNFTIAGLLSKGFYSGSDMIYPDAYKTQILPSQNKIINSISGQQRTINLSGVQIPNDLCYINDTYKTVLSGQDIEIEINKGSSNNQFNLSGTSNNITGHINLLLCKENNIGCIHIGQYLIDKRNQTIIKLVCLAFNGSDCSQWNQ